MELLLEILENAGFQVIAARNGVEALERFSAVGADAVITDMRMPRLDGLGVLTAVKASRPTVPVIIITGYSGLDDDRLVLAQHGADRLLTKPLDRIGDLVTAVRQSLPS